MTPTDEQQAIVVAFAGGKSLVIEAGAGCLAAETIVHTNRAGKGARHSIRHVAEQLAGCPTMTRRIHGRTVTQPTRRWDPSIPTYVARTDGDVSRLCLLRSAWSSGVKRTFTLTTADGRVIRATAEHPFLAASGEWARLDELSVGDAVRVLTGRSRGRQRAKKQQYRYVVARFHPHQVRDSSKRNKLKIPLHRAVVEADMNALDLEEYLRVLRESADESAQLEFLDPSLHVHHEDGNTLNNAPANLVVLTATEHHRLHAAAGHADHVLWQVGVDRVAQIQAYGEEPTFDIEVEDDPHNFIANGFVVHNTGKTSTLELLGRARPEQHMHYIAYNKAIAVDAGKRFPHNVHCSTAHSLAYRAIGHRYRGRLNAGRMPAREVAKLLDARPARLRSAEDKVLVLDAVRVARVVMATVDRYCRTATAQIEPWMVAAPDGLDNAQRLALAAEVAPLAAAAWEDLVRPDGQLPFRHDHYLKLWSLSRPRLDCDVLLLDEAQDADPLIADVVMRQRGHAQLVLVGDANQAIYCQPVGTRVRVPVPIGGGGNPPSGGPSWSFVEKPIEDLQVGDRVVSYNQGAWRLGAIRKRGCIVSGVTRRRHIGPMVMVTTQDGEHQSRYTPDHHCVVMLGDALADQWVVYLARRGGNYRVGCCQGRYESQNDAFGPLVRAKQEGADAIWVLSSHGSLSAARRQEATVQDQWGIPGQCFVSGEGEAYWAARDSNERVAAEMLVATGLHIDQPLVERNGAMLTRNRTPIVATARNLLSGMLMLVADRAVSHSRSPCVRMSSWQTIDVEEIPHWDGDVVSISVEGDHTYVADGIVTHNSWRGAIDAMSSFEADARLQLSQSFRFGPAIATEANKWLAILRSDLRLRGSERIASRVGEAARPDAILCRTNAGCVGQVMRRLDRGDRVALVGGGEQIRRLAEAAITLQAGAGTSHPDLMAFRTWAEVVEYAESDAGGELKTFVNLIEKHGADAVIRTVSRLVDERRASVVVSTAHKAKGREWGSVLINGDFRKPGEDADEVSRAEAMLAYVAVTRAKTQLDRAGLAWVDEWGSQGRRKAAS